ncbi:hypothetical protein [Haloprofundus marisrubri]|uniref:hypothetical protein n=1 Tax=Haloprofundus marisrubri TaxID=1514971 RepID=UPI0012BAA3FE|nr:hypothetical protein [Haloprofundus marisrubri]
MNSEVDTSILNSVNIKRFTKSVLEEFGAEIDRSDRKEWEVTFSNELSKQLGRQQGTLVFHPADREMGTGHLLVQPGTRFFSQLLELVRQPGTVGRLRLTEDDLQVTPPIVLRESGLDVNISDFNERTSDFALAFHFRVQFETPASFHSEEMFSVTIDPETQTRLPDLTARLTSHLPQLLQQNNEHSRREVSESKVEASYKEAQQAVVDRSRPFVSEIREEADESAGERIEEISEWYEQRRTELEDQIREQKEEVAKWRNKQQKARKAETRRRYIKNRKEAKRDLNVLRKQVIQKRDELDDKELKEIDEVIDRNEVNVDVSLLGVTEVTYVRGTLTLEIESNHADCTVGLSYLPATDDFHGLDCGVCSRDLTEGVLPRICASGHLVGDPCSTSCRNCGLAYCNNCETGSAFYECEICREDACESCAEICSSCGASSCDDHSEPCSSCDSSTCHLCGEECGTCGEFHCETHLSHCPDCNDYHCEDHTESCEVCGSLRCESHVDACDECGDLVCSDHSDTCTTCGKVLCDSHIEYCGVCSAESDDSQRGFCRHHSIRCSVGGEVICGDHRVSTTIGSGHVCEDHRGTCSFCNVDYSDTELVDGDCSACRSLGETDQDHIPPEVSIEFRSVKAGTNEAYMVILGKKLLGRNRVIVYDVKKDEETHRHSAGMFKQLLGDY